MKARRAHRNGFTLIEILIVVAILGILSAIVVPQFTNASESASEATLRAQLQRARSQIELFRAENGGPPPMIAQQWTPLIAGNYLQAAPENPMNGSTLVAGAPNASPAVGWVWRDKGNGTFGLFATDGTAAAEFVE